MARVTIDLYYDVGSTNSYFALHLLKRLADKHSAAITYHPFNLGYVFRANNYVLMDESKAKLTNRKRDLMRWAQRYDLPFQMPKRFPVKTSPALRGALAARELGREEDYLFAVFAAYWEANEARLDDPARIAEIAESAGLSKREFAQCADSPDVRQALVDETNNALERGVFGAPSIVVGDELFWGKDRMDFVEDELLRLQAQS